MSVDLGALANRMEPYSMILLIVRTNESSSHFDKESDLRILVALNAQFRRY